MKIVITRREEDSKSLIEASKQAGMESLTFPCLELGPPSDNYKSLDEAIRKNHLYDWIFFLSKNAADAFFSRLLEIGGHFFNLAPHLKLGVVGSSTAKFIQDEVGFPVDFVPSEFNSECFAKEFLEAYADLNALPGSDKKKVLLVRAELEDDKFQKEIEASGQFELDTALAYKTKMPEDFDLKALKDFLDDKTSDRYISFASSETVRNFKEMTKDLELSDKGVFFLSIGPKTSQTIKEEFADLDLPNILHEAKEAKIDQMIKLCIKQ